METLNRKKLLALAAAAALAPHAPLHALELANTDEYQIRLDTNLAYTLGARTSKPAEENVNPAASPGAPFVNDGDAAFKRYGLVFNRADISVEFDAAFKDKYRTGFRFSALGWYDQVYHRPHQPVDASTYNATSVSNTEFTRTARRMAGEDIDVYDFFVHGGFDLGSHPLSFRLGRHTLLWGESLFMSTNGIAAGQAPINATKALSVPIIAAKEVFMPVNQLSAALGLTDNLSLQGYYQLEYRETDVPPPGTYFSTADFVFQGAETFAGMPRGDDVRPKKAQGNWGLAMKFSSPDTGWDGGVYYTRYSEKTPEMYLDFSGVPSFRFVYPRNIESFGASASTTVGDANVAFEASYRRNMALFPAQGATASFTPITDDTADAGAQHPVGETFHLQASTIWVLPRVSLWDSSAFVAEIGGHHLVKATKNAAALDPTRSKNMAGVAMQFTPTYYHLVGDMDVDFPVSLAYNFTEKRSLIDPSFNGGTGGRSGKLGLGMKVKYSDHWRAGVNWTKYLGGDNQNQYGDRDFIALNVNYSF
jgi:hypothetical protein